MNQNKVKVSEGEVKLRKGYEQLTTTGATTFNGSSSSTGAFFRVLNRGGNWNEFFNNWSYGWKVVNHPEFTITNIVQDSNDPDNLLITITGGVFDYGPFYAFTGPKVV
jgi:hypothetical protein